MLVKLLRLFFFVTVVLSMALSGCTGLGKLAEGEYIFTGTEINYDSVHLLSNRREAQSELDNLIKTPNTKFLWMRPFLSIHNSVKEPKKEKGVRYWVKYKLGEIPVKLSDLNLPQINAAMVNRLNNLGHFEAEASFTTENTKRTAKVIFDIVVTQPYRIKSISFPESASSLNKKIYNARGGSLIKPGDAYSLSVLKEERSRIDRYLKENGYFYFNVDNLLFDADSTAGTRKIDMDLTVKPETSTISKTPFSFEKIFIYDDFSLESYHPDTLMINNYYYISSNHSYTPKTILNAVFIHPDSLYSRQNHYNTLSHLMGLGIYKFANARFLISDTLNGKMNTGIFLTPQKKISVGAEISAAIKTNNYAGPGLNLSFKDRNLFRGAELLTINLGARFETQFSGDYKGETSYEVTLNGTLTFPRFVPIRFNRNLSRQFVPQTNIEIGGGLFSRVRYYQLYSFNVALGYNWRTSDRISQQFKPVDVNFTNLAQSSEEFQEYLDENPTIKRSFEEQFIIGGNYTFTYSTLHLTKHRTNIFVSQGIDLAGNLASLITTATEGKSPSPDDQHIVLGVPYSQFVRLRNDLRFFIRIGKKDQIGMRLYTGAAIPYGNSSTIPYIRQFSVGGTNSVRAFIARTVGPGTFAPPDTIFSQYYDQTGDIKLETNLEYRFPIYGYFKGALFVDAGNIWLVNEDEQRPGGSFKWDSFYKELAIGSGFGIRLDFSIVIIRFDMAIPLRKPYLPEGDRWVFDKINLGSPSWRKDNFIMNIAIGYSF